MAGNNVLIGAHVADDDPLGAAKERDAQVVQFFLADPQGWKAPKPRADQDALVGAWDNDGIAVFVHSPYVLNLASTNNRIRIPSRKLLAAHSKAAAAVGARGLVVHGGHVTKNDDPVTGVDNWRKVFAEAEGRGGFEVPILIENTAGGSYSMARTLDEIARLWDVVGDYDPGFCLDTCHAFSAGIDLVSAVEKIKEITGRIDLVHCNDSRDEFGSSRDRHTTIGDGTIDPAQLVEVIRAADCPVVCETPGDKQDQDIAYLREHLG